MIHDTTFHPQEEKEKEQEEEKEEDGQGDRDKCWSVSSVPRSNTVVPRGNSYVPPRGNTAIEAISRVSFPGAVDHI